MSDVFEAIDFHDFHRRALPTQLCDGRGAMAAGAASALGSLAIRVRESGDAYTYRPSAGQMQIEEGDADAETVVEIEQKMWEGLVHDIESAPSLLYGGLAKGLRGDPMQFVRWEPALRAMYVGRPIYDPGAPMPAGLEGAPLDPAQSFTLEDSDADMAHFLKSMGYLLIRHVFTPDEVAAMGSDAEALRAQATQADQQSWWGKRADGDPILVRILNGHTRPRLAALHDDPRIARLSTLPAEKLVAKNEGGSNSVTVLWKQPGVSEGLGDLPWHRDCGMGGHALMCPTVNCSIHLGPATPAGGDLRFLPASWQASVGFAEGDDASAARGISLDAGPGDVSLHYGDVVHAAPPPESATGPFRTSILIGWGKPDFKAHRGGDHYNDALFQDGNAVPDMREMAARSKQG